MKEIHKELSPEELQERILKMKPIYSGKCVECGAEVMLPDKSWIGICNNCSGKEVNKIARK